MEKIIIVITLTIFLIICSLITFTNGSILPIHKSDDNISIRREELLDPTYKVIWDVDFNKTIVTFYITVKTIGFIGFGISNDGGMYGADIVIGGIWPNGTKYFEDCYGEGTFRPAVDEIQNYDLIEISENSTHTNLAFSRLFDTKDIKDTRIINGTTNFIWSFGPTDRILYHGPNRGTHSVNILQA